MLTLARWAFACHKHYGDDAMCDCEMKEPKDITWQDMVVALFDNWQVRQAFECQTARVPFAAIVSIDEARDSYIEAFISWVTERFGGVVDDCGLAQ
jgi:hypothetical protein